MSATLGAVIPGGVPRAVDLADEWDSAIEHLQEALEEQIDRAAYAASQRELIARIEAEITVSPAIPGRNEATWRAGVLQALLTAQATPGGAEPRP